MGSGAPSETLTISSSSSNSMISSVCSADAVRLSAGSLRREEGPGCERACSMARKLIWRIGCEGGPICLLLSVTVVDCDREVVGRVLLLCSFTWSSREGDITSISSSASSSDSNSMAAVDPGWK